MTIYRIGFDAKRLFFNLSGLGNYSRAVIQGLSDYAPQIQKIYFTPRFSKEDVLYKPSTTEQVVVPKGKLAKKFSGLWRSCFMGDSIDSAKLDVYHGLSSEFPLNIGKCDVKKIITIHDLIFLRFPHLYSFFDAKYYNYKYCKSTHLADTVIAISHQTKADIVQFWNVDPQKIKVLEQPCKSIFFETISEGEQKRIQKKYGLPSEYMLSVGTIEERKNVELIVRAMVAFNIRVPLVLIGQVTSYYQTVLNYATAHNFDRYIIKLQNVPDEDLPAIYQGARLFIYPSIFEGFGIPIVEALYSNIPIITSTESCLPDTGGTACSYVNPYDVEQMGDAINRLLSDDSERNRLICNALIERERFNPKLLTSKLVDIYGLG